LGTLIVVLGKTYSVPAHYARQTIELIQHETLQNSPDFCPVRLQIVLLTVKYGAWCRIVYIRCHFEMPQICHSAWSTHDAGCRRALWTMLMTNGGRLQACVN